MSGKKSDAAVLNKKSPIEVQLLPKEKYQLSYWSGGKTSQILIWPPESDFKNHEFLWRISLATLETESSVFTKFNGFHRLLHLLAGKSKLSFADGRVCMMNAGDEVCFLGNDDVESHGMASDINLIMFKGVYGEMRTIEVDAQNWTWTRSIPFGGEKATWCCLLYLLSGEIEVENAVAKRGDSIIIHPEPIANCWWDPTVEKMFHSSNHKAQLLECMVWWENE